MNTQFKKGLIPWNKGKSGEYKYPNRRRPKPFSEEHKKKIGLNGFHYGMSGKKMSTETRELMSEAHKGDKTNFWKGGITPEITKIRHSIELRLWRESVFARDNWTCRECGIRGGYLNAHHIKLFAKFPELRTSIENGIALCKECHYKLHKELNQLQQQMPAQSVGQPLGSSAVPIK